MKDLFEGIGCLIALGAIILSIAGIPFLGPIPIVVVFAIGYSLYKSKGNL